MSWSACGPVIGPPLRRSKPRRDRRRRLGRCTDRDDLEIDQIVPIHRPGPKVIFALGFHDLKAPLEVEVDPAIDVCQALRGHPSSIPEPPIDLDRLSGAKVFDHHESHRSQLSPRRALFHQGRHTPASSPGRRPARVRGHPPGSAAAPLLGRECELSPYPFQPHSSFVGRELVDGTAAPRRLGWRTAMLGACWEIRPGTHYCPLVSEWTATMFRRNHRRRRTQYPRKPIAARAETRTNDGDVGLPSAHLCHRILTTAMPAKPAIKRPPSNAPRKRGSRHGPACLAAQ